MTTGWPPGGKRPDIDDLVLVDLTGVADLEGQHWCRVKKISVYHSDSENDRREITVEVRHGFEVGTFADDEILGFKPGPKPRYQPCKRTVSDDYRIVSSSHLSHALSGGRETEESPAGFVREVLQLIAKAEPRPDHMRRMWLAFPRIVAARKLWQSAGPDLTAGQLYAHLDEIEDA